MDCHFIIVEFHNNAPRTIVPVTQSRFSALVVKEANPALVSLNKLCIILVSEVGCTATTEVFELVVLSSENPLRIKCISLQKNYC